MADQTYFHLDDALIRLRRLFSGPASGPVDRAAWPGIDLSTVLVADAVHRLVDDQPSTEATVSAVAQRLDVTHSTASRLVDRAVRAGVLDRRGSAQDARRVVLRLTQRGTALVVEARAYRQRLLVEVLADWPPTDVATLTALLARLADDIHHGAAPHERVRGPGGQ